MSEWDEGYMEGDRKRKGKGGDVGITFSFQKIKIIKRM